MSPYSGQHLLLFFKILALCNLYPQYSAGTHNLEIKSPFSTTGTSRGALSTLSFFSSNS